MSVIQMSVKREMGIPMRSSDSTSGCIPRSIRSKGSNRCWDTHADSGTVHNTEAFADGHTMGCFQPKKEGSFDTCYNMDEPGRHHAMWNKPVIRKKNILYDSTKLRSLEQSHLKRWEVEWRSPGAGGGSGGERVCSVHSVSVWKDGKRSADGWWWRLHKKILSATELYI